MRLDEPLDDVEPEPRAATPLGPPELPEDARHEFGGDAVALVAHRDRDRAGRGARGGRPGTAGRAGRARVADDPGAGDFGGLYHDSHGTSTVPHRVLDEVPENLVHLVGVEPGFRQFRGNDHTEPVRGIAGRDAAGDYLLYTFGDVDELTVNLHPARLDAGHVKKLGDEPGDPVSIRVDGLQHDPLLVIGEP